MAATPLELEAIKAYLISVGCKIEYPILVNAFKKHLYNPDPDVQGRVRTQFKDFVNRLATVSLENNMKFIQLRPEFRPPGFKFNTQKPSQPMQQQQPAPLNAPQAPNERQRVMVVENRSPPQQMMQEPTRPRSLANSQPQQPVRHQQQARHQQITSQSPRLPPSAHDQIDSPCHNTQQNFQFPTNQAKPQMQPQQQHSPPNSQQHNMPQRQHNSMNQSHGHDAMVINQPPRSSRPLPQQYAIDTANQQKSLPPSPHFHARTQSQPVPAQASFLGQHQQQQQQQYASSHHHQQQQQHHQAVHSPLAVINHNVVSTNHLKDDSAFLMPPPPPPHGTAPSGNLTSSPLRAPRDQLRKPDTPTVARTASTVGHQMPPPRPPPRRRQSTASLFKPSPSKPIEKMSREASQDLARRSISGRVREHATRFNSSASTSDLSALIPKRNSSMKENRLSRESVFSGLTSALQRNGSQSRSRSSHRGEDESDSSSLQPIDPLRRKWALAACNCNYNNLVGLLREDPKLASCKDIVNGYTALHWAAKFGNLDIIKLIAGTHQVSANIKSSAGHTPLHVAYIFNRFEAANLLTQSYRASQQVRDHSGKKPKFYLQSQ